MPELRCVDCGMPGQCAACHLMQESGLTPPPRVDPKWESVEGGITHEGDTLIIELVIPANAIFGYRVYLPVTRRGALSDVLSKMVGRIDEALYARA